MPGERTLYFDRHMARTALKAAAQEEDDEDEEEDGAATAKGQVQDLGQWQAQLVPNRGRPAIA